MKLTESKLRSMIKESMSELSIPYTLINDAVSEALMDSRPESVISAMEQILGELKREEAKAGDDDPYGEGRGLAQFGNVGRNEY